MGERHAPDREAGGATSADHEGVTLAWTDKRDVEHGARRALLAGLVLLWRLGRVGTAKTACHGHFRSGARLSLRVSNTKRQTSLAGLTVGG
jgi:hypothetical protein